LGAGGDPDDECNQPAIMCGHLPWHSRKEFLSHLARRWRITCDMGIYR
jgi:hypothetical protein